MAPYLPKTSLEWVNYALHCVGLCLVAIVGVRLCRRDARTTSRRDDRTTTRRDARTTIWRQRPAEQVLDLRPPPENDLQFPHIFLAFAAVSLFTPLVLTVVQAVSGAAAATQPSGVGALTPEVTFAQTLGQILTLSALLWIGQDVFRGGLRHWGLDWRRFPSWLWRAALVDLAVWPICSGLLLVTAVIFQVALPDYRPPEHQTISTLLREHAGSWQWCLSILGAVGLAPLVEELFFRGLLQPAIAAWSRSPWIGVLVSGVAFGCLHMSQPQVVPALAFFGIVLGYAYARTRSLTFVILIHALFNSRTILWIVLGAEVKSG